MSSGFDFGQVEAWEVSTSTILGPGNYVCTIVDIDDQKDSSGGYPMVTIQLQAPQGDIRDWLVNDPGRSYGVQKLAALFDAAQQPRPDVAAGEYNPETGRLSATCMVRLMGKTVGVVVREEDDNRDLLNPKKSSKVAGYVTPDKVTNAGPSAPAQAAPGDALPVGTRF